MNKLEILNQKIKEAQALDAKAKGGTELTDDELGKLEALAEEIASLKAEIAADTEAAEKRTARLAAARAGVSGVSDWLQQSAGRRTAPGNPEPAEPTRQSYRGISIPDRARRYGTPQNFMRISASRAEAQERAFRLGAWVAACAGNKKYRNWCEKNGIEVQAVDHVEGSNEMGGFFVPDALDADIIDLREQYGVFPRFARKVPMSSLNMKRLRRAGGLTAYYVGETTNVTKSTKSWDWVEMTAKDLAALAIFSRDLDDDSVISIGDDLAREMAYAFAVAIDNAGFVGDGTSTYGRITGITNALKNLSGTIANIAGLVVGTGNLYSELALVDFEGVAAKLPNYANNPNTRWFCHQSFYWNVMHRILIATGGTTRGDVEAGRAKNFLGWPVEFTFAMPSVEANSQVCCVLGDLSLAADMGDRAGTTLSFSDQASIADGSATINLFQSRQKAVLAAMRYDINCHDVGNASGTASARVPGPVVGLITAAS